MTVIARSMVEMISKQKLERTIHSYATLSSSVEGMNIKRGVLRCIFAGTWDFRQNDQSTYFIHGP